MDFKTFFFKLGLFGFFLLQHGHSERHFELESIPATWDDAKMMCGNRGSIMVPGRWSKALVRSLRDGQEVWLHGWRALIGSKADAKGKLLTVMVDFSRSLSEPIRVVCNFESIFYDPGYKEKTIDDARAKCASDKAMLADVDTKEHITYLATKLLNNTLYWVYSISSTASPIKQCLMAKRVDNGVDYIYDDCERQLHFFCLKDDDFIESFAPLIYLKKARYEEFQQTIEQHLLQMSSLSVAMAGSSTTTSSSVIQSDIVPSVTSIPSSESSSFTLPAVEDAQTESIKPSKSLTFSDSNVSSSDTFRTTSFYDTKAGLSNYGTDDNLSDHADHYSMYGGLDTSFTTEYRHKTSPSVSYAPMLSETDLFEPSSDISETIASTTLTECQESDPYTISSDTSTTQIINDSSSYLYSEIMPSQSIVLLESPPFHTKETDMSKLSGTEKTNILTTKNTYDFHVTVSPYDDFESSGWDDIDTYENISEVKLYDISTNQELYSDITPSKSFVLMESFPHHTKDSDKSKLSGTEKTHILTTKSTYDFHVTVSPYDDFESSGLDDIDTYENIYEVKLYEISTRQELYSDITPSKSLVLMESFPLHSKDSDMSKLSGSEKTHILTPSSAYDFHVTVSPYDDFESSGLDDIDTYENISEVKLYEISTSQELYSDITPSKSLVLMESFPLHSKDSDMSKLSGSEKTHILTPSSAYDYQVIETQPTLSYPDTNGYRVTESSSYMYDDYESSGLDENGTYDDTFKNKVHVISTRSDLYSAIIPSKSLVLMESLPLNIKDMNVSKVFRTEKIHISMKESAFYQSVDFDDSDTNGVIDNDKLYEISPIFDLYSTITPSTSLVLTHLSPFHTEDMDKSKLSVTEKTRILMSQRAYDNQVTESPYYDSSGFVYIDTNDNNYYYDISASLESIPIHTKFSDMIKITGTEKTHMLTSQTVYDYQVTDSSYDEYDSRSLNDKDTAFIEGVTASNAEGTGDNSGLTKTKIDAAIDGDVSENDYNDDENRHGNQSDDKTRDSKEPKEAFSETGVGLWVTFGILVLIVVVAAVNLAVFLWRRRQEQKSKDRMKPNGAATPPGETMDNLKENGAPRENVTFINPAYDI